MLPHRRSDISHFVRSGDDTNVSQQGTASQVLAPLQRSQVAFVKATPRNRSHNDFIRAGLRQSIGAGRRSTLFQQEVEMDNEDDEPTEREVYCTERGPIIDGVELRLASRATDAKLWTPRRLWDRTKWSTLPGDVRQAFYRHATGYVLSKTNKLSAPKVTSDNDQFLVQVQNLQSQIKIIWNHMVQYDIADCMYVVIPVDVMRSVTIEKTQYTVFEDYPRLHECHVANSCTWYNRWVTDEYVHENMVLTLNLLQNNTDESLWNKCYERYEEFEPMQQGGPLMAFLILKLIQDSSEKALEHLKAQLETLKISSIPGEDVEVAVSLIKATHRVLKCASSKTKSYVPSDFSRTVFVVFQTTSVHEFNLLFKDEQRRIQKAADMDGARPVWPAVSKILNLATNSYRRMKASGEWLKPSKKTAFTGEVPQTSDKKKTYVIICWNCGGQHLLKECPKPKDENRIQAARKKFRAKLNERRKGRSSGSTPPKRKTGEDGKPMILNKKGVYVLDQKAYKASLSQTSSGGQGGGTGDANATSPTANVAARTDHNSPQGSEQDDTSSSRGVTFRADAVRSILRRRN